MENTMIQNFSKGKLEILSWKSFPTMMLGNLS